MPVKKKPGKRTTRNDRARAADWDRINNKSRDGLSRQQVNDVINQLKVCRDEIDRLREEVEKYQGMVAEMEWR